MFQGGQTGRHKPWGGALPEVESDLGVCRRLERGSCLSLLEVWLPGAACFDPLNFAPGPGGVKPRVRGGWSKSGANGRTTEESRGSRAVMYAETKASPLKPRRALSGPGDEKSPVSPG